MAYTLKTQATGQTIESYLSGIEDLNQREDCRQLVNIMQTITKQPAVIWGKKLVGFGEYHYESTRSACKGDWFLTGFATRKQGLTIYIMPGFSQFDTLLSELGKHKTGKSCLYIKSLSAINLDALKQIIQRSVDYMVNTYC